MITFFQKCDAVLRSLFPKYTVLLTVLIAVCFVWYKQPSIILFLLILLVLVFVHELGHFAVAKWTGMRVDEFAFGFPPRIWSKKVGETTYAVNALPLGGYVSIWGENGEPNDQAKTDPRAFGNRPWWAQLATLVAGVVMNMLLALVIFIMLSYGTVLVSPEDPQFGSRVTDPVLVVRDSQVEGPAYKAGVVPRSTIHTITSKGQKASLTSATSAVAFIERHSNDPITLTYTDPTGALASTTIAAVYGIVPDKKVIGLSFEIRGTVETSLLDAIILGARKTYVITTMTLSGLGGLIASIGQGESVINSLSGPWGVAKIVGETTEYGYEAVLTLVAFLSINLAIFNILPIPALDGGRMLVVLGETISRRKFPMKWMMAINSISFLLLILLLVVVTIKDIFI